LDLELLSRVSGIIIIDLVLSGDNAVVIGLAARRLDPRQRRLAIFWGGFGAIALRVLFTALAAILLVVPLLQFVGGAVLIWIAYKLLRDDHADETANIREGRNLVDAVRTIVLADVIMSLDNILAVGGVAHGDIGLLLFGLGLSMPIILFGSNLVAWLTDRVPWLAYVGSGVLAWAAAEMMTHDQMVGGYIPRAEVTVPGIGLGVDTFAVVVTVGTLVVAYLVNRWAARRAVRPAAVTVSGVAELLDRPGPAAPPPPANLEPPAAVGPARTRHPGASDDRPPA